MLPGAATHGWLEASTSPTNTKGPSVELLAELERLTLRLRMQHHDLKVIAEDSTTPDFPYNCVQHWIFDRNIAVTPMTTGPSSPPPLKEAKP